MLNQRGCNINKHDQLGSTVMHLCCIYMVKHPSNEHEYMKIVRELVHNEHFDINAQDDAGTSALMYACLYEQTECVDALLTQLRCKLIVRDANGEIALHHLLRKSIDVENTATILCLMVAREESASCSSILTNEGLYL